MEPCELCDLKLCSSDVLSSEYVRIKSEPDALDFGEAAVSHNVKATWRSAGHNVPPLNTSLWFDPVGSVTMEPASEANWEVKSGRLIQRPPKSSCLKRVFTGGG